MSDPAFLSAIELAAGFRSGELSPVAVASALLDRIEALDAPVHAIVHRDRATTLAMAEAAERRHRAGTPVSPLDGVPATVKDLSHVAGWPRRRGSLLLAGAPPSREDTPAVARMREAGLVFLGKTATPEGGCKVVTRSALTGETANPWDLSRTPGGSSGGASAALAMGFGPLAQGSDGAGSIRIPACYTNSVGLKPGFGRVPAFPPDPDMPHSVVGPMARTVADVSALLAVMSGPEPRDPFAWPVPFAAPADLDDPDLAGLRVALSARMGMRAPLADPEVDALVARAGPMLAAAGAEIIEADPTWPLDPLRPFRVFWETGCMAAVEAAAPGSRETIDPLIRRVAEAGRRVSTAEYLGAVEGRLAIAAASHAFFSRFDLLVCPVMPVAPYRLGRDVPDGFADEDWSWCPYTYPWNMTGQPAASVPVGFTACGLPVGVQIVGRMGEEATILRAASAIERRAGCLGRMAGAALPLSPLASSALEPLAS